jgi:hypothetical protein
MHETADHRKSVTYLQKVEERLAQLLLVTPEEERHDAMSACVKAAGDHLNASPSRDDQKTFSREMFADPSMVRLVEQDEHKGLAMSGEFPEELDQFCGGPSSGLG